MEGGGREKSWMKSSDYSAFFQQSLKRPLNVLESRFSFKGVAFLPEQARLSTPVHSVTG